MNFTNIKIKRIKDLSYINKLIDKFKAKNQASDIFKKL